MARTQRLEWFAEFKVAAALFGLGVGGRGDTWLFVAVLRAATIIIL